MSYKKYLVDVNLPKHFSFFNKPEFVFVVDINSRMTDFEIWDYALAHDKIILTKDTDFFHRSLLSVRKAKVVHFNLGNLKLRDLYEYFTSHWENIEHLLNDAFLIVAERDNLRVVF